MYINSLMFKIKILIFIFLFGYSISSNAEVIKQIQINGNERISEQTIINFADIKIGKDVKPDELNIFLKNLYETNFFEDVNLTLTNNLLIIDVKELPIIQEIVINGIKANKTKEVKDGMNLKEKNPFNETLVQNDLDNISNIFKNSGYYFVSVNVSVEKNKNNTVNLIFDIDRGDQATIKKIKFIGDKKYKDRKLHSIITSEENKFWKFITSAKYINQERIDLDKRLLKNFYLNKGFYDVSINDAYTKLINNKDFILTFNINAGEKYNFGNLNLDLPVDYDENDFKKINNLFNEIKDSQYSLNKIEEILDEIDKIALSKNYEFIDAKVNEEKKDNFINFTFEINETKKLT